MDSRLRDYSPRFVLDRGVIVEGRVSTRPIVEHLNVFEHVLFRFRSYGIVPMVHEFPLQCSEEALDTGVVSPIAGAAHAGRDAIYGEQLLVGSCRMTAAIRMMQTSGCGLPGFERRAEGLLG